MSPRTKEQLDIIREEKTQLILDAALELFASKGFESASISEVAKKAGVSKGLIYNYFESKDEILKSLVDDVMSSIWERLGFEKMERMGDKEYLDFINLSLDITLEDPTHWRLYFAIFTQPQVLEKFMPGMMERAEPYLRLLYQYYEEQGYEDPAIQMRYVAAIIDGIQMHIMLDPENFPVEGVRKILVEQLTRKP